VSGRLLAARRLRATIASAAATIVLGALGALGGCAEIGRGPPGGPEDHAPPKLLKVTPDTGALNVKPKEVVFRFDEVVSERPKVVSVMKDLYSVGCQILTLGQYLQPSEEHVPIVEYVHPDTFKMLEETGYKMGFLEVNAGPLVRSSYHAARTFEKIRKTNIEGGI
jgi:hypothetical protein